MWWNLASLPVAGDVYEIAAACLMKFLLLGLSVQQTVHFKTGINRLTMELISKTSYGDAELFSPDRR